MIIPSRWFAGGKGLDEFREKMLNDNRIRELHDYPIGADCFPGTRIAGGVCYFLWDRDNAGLCKVFTHKLDAIVSKMERPLLETGADTFVRYNGAIPILRKVISKNEHSFSEIVSSLKPYGLRTDFFCNPKKYNMPPIFDKKIRNGITIYGILKYKTVKRYVPLDYPISKGNECIAKYKVFVSQVLDNGFDWTKERLKPFLGKPNEICTETFLSIGGGLDDEQTARNIISYMNTKFFHLLMFLKKISHHVVAKVYSFVPMQDFSEPWTDEKLYQKYGLTQDEIAFIESMIRPIMDVEGK
jgi:site-specific DNA-methyltransferase (adenine-specific)